MLPHILNSTARAAAAVQNQTHTIRNVLHLQSSGPSSGSGPSWNNGPGPGGSKFNTGSRFYTGYNVLAFFLPFKKMFFDLFFFRAQVVQ
jgi:hypothetical protein